MTLLEMEFEGLPPTINHLYRNCGHRRYKTADGQNYQDRVSYQISKQWGNKPPYAGAVAFAIILQTENKRKWDIDNRIKALQDCLQLAGVIKDDRQIESLHIKRTYGNINSTHITLKEYEQ